METWKFKKGIIPLNKGKKDSEITKLRKKEAWKRRKQKPDYKPTRLNKFHTEETKRKMSESNKGKHSQSERKGKTFKEYFGEEKSKEISKKLRNKKLGDKHPNYRGGTQFDDYDKNYNNLFKEKIKERDKYTCLLCGIKKGELQTHHIDYNRINTIQENVITLCKSCHMKTTWNREYWIKLLREILKIKYNYSYVLSDEKSHIAVNMANNTTI